MLKGGTKLSILGSQMGHIHLVMGPILRVAFFMGMKLEAMFVRENVGIQEMEKYSVLLLQIFLYPNYLTQANQEIMTFQKLLKKFIEENMEMEYKEKED